MEQSGHILLEGGLSICLDPQATLNNIGCPTNMGIHVSRARWGSPALDNTTDQVSTFSSNTDPDRILEDDFILQKKRGPRRPISL